jgi:hypothetical protein
MLVAEHPSATLAELNRDARRWLLNDYGMRNHGTTGEPPLKRFQDYEQASLISLPPVPYTVARWGQAVVHPDHYIQIMGHRISLSTEYVGKTVQVMLTPKLAKIYLNNELIKIKPLTEGKTTYTDWEDFPPTVQFALSEKTPRWLIKSARETGGEPFAELVTGLLSVPGFSYLRRVLGLNHCVKGYSVAVVTQAATLALQLDRPITTQLFQHMLESIHNERHEAPSLDGLPLSATTESFMRSADYFLPASQAQEVANG